MARRLFFQANGGRVPDFLVQRLFFPIKSSRFFGFGGGDTFGFSWFLGARGSVFFFFFLAKR